MKKLLIALFLLANNILACDQIHEEIEGFKIGCPFEIKEGYLKGAKSPMSDVFDDHYLVKKGINFFDHALVFVTKNKISAVFFKKHYPINQSKAIKEQYIKDVRRLAKSLINKWGNFNTSSADYLLNDSDKPLKDVHSFNDMVNEKIETMQPNSEALGWVAITSDYDEKTGIAEISVQFDSKEFIEKLSSDERN